MKTWLQLATKDSVSFDLSSPLILGEPYVLRANTVYPLLVSIDGVYIGKLENGILQFNATNSMANTLTLTSVEKVNNLDLQIKLEQGLFATEYSPAPEDGYGYIGDDGSYHIESVGGLSDIKYYLDSVIPELNSVYRSSVQILSFNDELKVSNNQNIQSIPKQNRYKYDDRFIGNGVDRIKIEFIGKDISSNLDFIASSPMIFESRDMPIIERVELSNEGNLNKSVMQQLKASSRCDNNLKGEWLEYERKVESQDFMGFVNHGSFRVIEQEYSVDEDKTAFTMYDSMIKTHKEVLKQEFTIEFPTTLLQLFKHVASVCELDTDVTSFKNGDTVVESDEWTNTEYTYRDILDHIAGIVGNVIGIKNDKLDIWGYVDTGIIINENRTKTWKIGEKVGSFNILNVTQEPQHWNEPYPPNWTEIPQELRSEYVIVNNPIVDRNRTLYSPIVFENIKDLSYTEFEADTFGWGIFDIGDIVTVKDVDGNSYQSIITSEQGVFNQDFSSVLQSKKLTNAKDEYVVATDKKREGQRTYFLVDQQNGIIQGLVDKTDETNDKVSSLTIDVDKVQTEVSNVHNGNIIIGLNGEQWYNGWIGGSNALYVDDMTYQDGLTYAMGFIFLKDLSSLNGMKMSMYNNGFDISPKGFVFGGEQYSLRFKNIKFKPFTIDILEYSTENGAVTKSTKVTPTNIPYYEYTLTLQSSTKYVALRYNRTGVSPSDRIEISEQMFNRGLPKSWFASSDEALAYSKTTRTQLSGQIIDVAESVNMVDGKINNTTVKIDSVEGVQIWNNNGKGLTVYDNNNTAVIELNSTGKLVTRDMIAENMYATNAYVSGVINATSGNIGNMILENGVMTYTSPSYEKDYDESDLSRIRSILLLLVSPTPYDYHVYDFDNNGIISIGDLAVLKSYLLGNQPKPIKYIKSRVSVGTQNGEVRTQVLYGANDTIGATSVIQGEKITTKLGDFNALAAEMILLNGRYLSVDANGFVKATPN